jgi:methionyl-tRNA formyltransferase
MSELNVIFAGTPEFSRVSLEALVEAGVSPVAVLTQPDRPAGRGKRMTASPVKRFAVTCGLPVLQPQTLRGADIVAELRDCRPDVIVVVAYGLLLPQDVLDIPRAGCLNVHASILPRWRGAAPIQAAILAGDDISGVSLMQMTAGLDCGPVFAVEQVAIGPDETAGELHDRLARAGADLLARELGPIVAGRVVAQPQDDSRATHAPKIRNADARLDWAADAAELERAVRAFNPVPGAWFMLGGERVKCWQARIDGDVEAPIGTIVSAGEAGIVIACGQGGLSLQSLQRPGRRPVTAAEFAAQLELVGRRL